MAKFTNGNKVVIVQKGDNLWNIAKAYLKIQGTSNPSDTAIVNEIDRIAGLNSLENPDLIYPDQKLQLVSASSSGSTNTSARTVTVKQFGLQADVDNKIFITWKWDKNDTDHYQVQWQYYTKDKEWFVGSDGTTTYKYSIYDIPSNATQVRVRVKPIAKKEDDGEKYIWTDSTWTNYGDNTHKVVRAPSVPPVPTVTINGLKLTAEVYNLKDNPSLVEFEVIKDDKDSVKKVKPKVYTSSAAMECTVEAGGRYKVHCRAIKDDIESNWSDYSSNIDTIPSAPGSITKCEATSETSVVLAWEEVGSATSYDIEYTIDESYFEGSDKVTSKTGITTTTYEITSGLETGNKYYFRVRAVNDKGSSDWTAVSSIVLGSGPAQPTTWSSTTTAMVGDTVTLYWVHNSKDGSSETGGWIYIEAVDPETEERTVVVNKAHTKLELEKEEGVASSYSFDTSTYQNGVRLEWKVRTKGIANGYGDWSVTRAVDVYVPPTLTLNVTDNEGKVLGSTSFYKIEELEGTFTETDEEVDVEYLANVYKKVDESATLEVPYEVLTVTGHQVLLGINSDGKEIYYCVIDSVKYRVENVSAGYANTTDVVETVTNITTIDNEQVFLGVTSEGEEIRYVIVDSVYYIADYAHTSSNEQVYLGTSYIGEQNYCYIKTNRLKSFPIKISALAGSSSQKPIGWHLSIVSNQIYETVDNDGNDKTVNNGEVIFSKYYDETDPFPLNDPYKLSANELSLESGVSYTLSCIVSMDSGLTAENSVTFTAAWAKVNYDPFAEVSFDEDSFVTYIRPYCAQYTYTYYKVVRTLGVYSVIEETIDGVYGSEVPNAVTTTGEQVYYGTTSENEKTYYCAKETIAPMSDVWLSVYRRESDGTFTEIMANIDGAKNITVTDPHPSLDYARYRIVSVSKETGVVNYYDVPGYYIGCTSAIIQWNESWKTFDTLGGDDDLEQPPWAGSLVELPYNIDVSYKTNPDVSMVEYIGRDHPVAYYGTQVGETATWNIEIPKEDKATIYALRRLQIWMGNVYVREPYGSGYWASVKVTFGLKHRVVTTPVTIEVTRVEGGA